MAFDMHLGDDRQSIAAADEYLFTLASESANAYPTLASVWSRFYTQFTLGPDEAERLLHELLALYAERASNGGRER